MTEFKIKEGFGIQNLYIGMTKKQFDTYINHNNIHITGSNYENDINPVFELPKSVTVFFNKDTGLVYKISFGGKMFNWENITPNNLISELKEKVRYLLIDDFDKVFFVEGISGICFESYNKDFQISNSFNVRFDLITVYDETLETKDTGEMYDRLDLYTGDVEYS